MKLRIPWLYLVILGMMILPACSTQQTPTATREAGLSGEELELVPTSTGTPVEASPTDHLEIETDVVASTPEPDLVDALESDIYPAPGYQFPTPVTDPGSYPYPSPEQASPPPAKTALEASDPASVNLVSGKPTLLEFFAFW